MKSGNLHFLRLTFLLMLMSGCIDEITFESDFGESQLVVEGSIHNGAGPYTVRIGQTEPDVKLPKPISGAAVELVDSHDNRMPFIENEPGTYKAAGHDFTGRPGETYHIEIALPDGRLYSSEPETMPLQTASGTVHVDPGFVPEQTASGGTIEVPVVFASADTDLPESGSPLFLKWNVEGLFAFRETQRPGPFAPPAKTCFITEKISTQNIILFSATQSGPGQITDQLLTEKRVIFHEFFIRYYFNVVTTSITERRYNYWQNVDKMINQSGTIFDVPPATVPGNIKSNTPDAIPALGYFEASVKDTTRAFITSSEFSFYIPDPCAISRVDRHPNCDNCTEIENSTLERPHYF